MLSTTVDEGIAYRKHGRQIKVSEADLWKYFGDTTVSEIFKKRKVSNAQLYADELV